MASDQGNTNSNASSVEPGSKRRRIALACKACRIRKSKCDGHRPVCSSCDELGFDCTYVQSASSSNVIVGKEYLFSLETRLNCVEERLNTIQNGNQHHSEAASSHAITARPQKHTSFEMNSGGQETSRILSIVDEDANISEEMEGTTDGMGAVSFADEEDSGFLGPSSNIAFTRHIRRALARVSRIGQSGTTPTSQLNLPLDGAITSVSRPASPHDRSFATNHSPDSKVDLYALPSEAVTSSLISLYFSNTGLLFPYIHEETFLAKYAEMKERDFTKISKTWLGLLNMILAMSTNTVMQSGLNAEERATQSDIYYRRGIGLCEKQMMRGTSLEIVQFLLLMGQYLQGTQRSIQTWAIHGLAVKASFQLGLHSTQASHRFPPLEREIRKRTWFLCVMLDRTLSMTFGRPATIPESYVRLELPMAYDLAVPGYIETDPIKHISVDFYSATIKLYRILWRVIDSVYGGNLGIDGHTSGFENMAQNFRMEHELGGWVRDLPPTLRLLKSENVLDSSESEHAQERFRVVLTLRYHNLRILLHRRTLVSFLDITGKPETNNEDLTMLQQVGPNSLQISIQSSIEIITIIHSIVRASRPKRDLLGAWWFSLYYTFNAALVILASVLVCSKVNIPGFLSTGLIETAKPHVHNAIEALELLEQGHRIVDRCVRYLAHLAYLIDGETTTTTSPPFVRGNGYINAQPSDVNFTTAFHELSPLGMDLGEFLIEDDLSIFNRWNMPTISDNPVPDAGTYAVTDMLPNGTAAHVMNTRF